MREDELQSAMRDDLRAALLHGLLLCAICAAIIYVLV